MNSPAAQTSLPGEPEICIDIRSAGWNDAAFDVDDLCRRAAAAAVAAARQAEAAAEISIVLADDAFVRELNKAWRHVDAPTNVLAFPCSAAGDPAIDGGERLLGDVVMAFETARVEADRMGLPLRNHVAHLIVHGVLHLLGYDHETDAEAAAMEQLEVEALAGLGIANPYEE